MKILFLDFKTFGNKYMVSAFERCCDPESMSEVISYPFEDTVGRNNPVFEDKFEKDLNEIHPDFVFSFNFYPIISKVCNKVNIKYVSWVYDSPQVSMYSYTITFPCNFVFVFDSKVYETFHKGRIDTVYYLPLAADVNALDKMKVTPPYECSKANIEYDDNEYMLKRIELFYINMMKECDDYFLNFTTP